MVVSERRYVNIQRFNQFILHIDQHLIEIIDTFGVIRNLFLIVLLRQGRYFPILPVILLFARCFCCGWHLILFC